MKAQEIAAAIKPFVLGWIAGAGSGAGPYAPSPHDIGGGHHSGSLADAQIPNALLRDGSRSLLGNLDVAAGVTLDGVDLSAFKSDYDVHVGTANAHHDPVTIGTGGLSAKLGLSAQVLTLAAINHSDLSNINANQHVDHTAVTLTAGDGLTGGGTIAASRTFAVGAGTGISVSADAVAVNTAHDFTWTGEHTFQATLTTRHIFPEATDTYDVGSSALWYRQQFVSQINAAVFAEEQIVLMGGWLYIPKDAGTFAAEVGSADTQIDFGKAMTNGDHVLVKAYDKAGSIKTEYITVGSLVSGTTYNVTRDRAGAHATDPNWTAGVPFAVLGQNGNGRIELNAYDTPRVQVIQQGAAYNAQTEMLRFGDLNGNWGYSAAAYGLALGQYAANYGNLTWDPANGLRLRTYTTTVLQLDNSGNADVSGTLKMRGAGSAIAIGSTPPTGAAAGTGLWIDRTGIYGLASNVLQAKFSAADGTITAGGGSVVLDDDGINLPSDNSNALRFMDGATLVGAIRYYENYVLGSDLVFFNDGAYSSKYFTFSGGNVRVLSTGSVVAGGGLYAGSSGGSPGTGNVVYTGALGSVKGGTTHTVYGFHPLTTPLTSSSWDGNDTISTGTWSWDTSTWGAPAGIKAALVQLSGAWSSASAGNYAALRPKGGSTNVAKISALTTGQQDMTVVVPCDGNGDIDIIVAGASMLNAVLRLWGYWI